jgi:SHS2 domain-containing protein
VAKKRFEFLEHVSDAFVAGYGNTLEEAFENVALGMFEVMTNTSKVKPRIKTTIKAEAEDKQALLYTWLEQLLIKFETEGNLYSKFKVDKIEETSNGFRLTSTEWGETYNPKKHSSRTAIKAVTYHGMEISEVDGKFTVKVLFDI